VPEVADERADRERRRIQRISDADRRLRRRS
jgi:hypothetical protein